jgi:hypothetical protein
MAETKFGVKEVMNVTFYDLSNNQPVLYIDTLKLSNLENTAEESTARGGWGNPILVTWDYNREANFAVQDALMSFEGMSLMTGNDVTTTAETIYKRETLTVADGEATLSETPSDEDAVFIYDFVEGISGGEVTYLLSGTALTDITGLSDDNTKIVAYYPYTNSSSDIKTITITAEDFPGTYKVVGDTLIRNASTGEDESFQLVLSKVKLQPGFTITMQAEGDPSVFDMNLKAMRPDAAGEPMVKMVKYSEGS